MTVGPLAGPPAWTQRLPYSLRRIWRPGVYQGGSRHDGYFEGWYVKLVDAAGRYPLAFIPGVSRDASGGTSHSFVQVVRPGGSTVYLDFPEEAFDFDPARFAIAVGPNRFDESGLDTSLCRDALDVSGAVQFGPLAPWPVTSISPGIMGWYRFVPRMECYHGVISLDHELIGSLRVDGETIDYTGGRGYIEKDWGSSFPSSWVWAQSNHFDGADGTSVSVSVARIPWLGSAFIGFIAGVWHEERLYRFTTYTGAKLECFESWQGGARFVLRDREHELAVEVDGALPAALKAPTHGRMVARADESLGATLRVRLGQNGGGTLFAGTGQHAGVEVMDTSGELGAGLDACPASVMDAESRAVEARS